jgi:hypothetical protein
MARSPAVQLAPGVWRIPTVVRAAVNSFAFVEDDGSVTLVDCGVKKASPVTRSSTSWASGGRPEPFARTSE